MHPKRAVVFTFLVIALAVFVFLCMQSCNVTIICPEKRPSDEMLELKDADQYECPDISRGLISG